MLMSLSKTVPRYGHCSDKRCGYRWKGTVTAGAQREVTKKNLYIQRDMVTVTAVTAVTSAGERCVYSRKKIHANIGNRCALVSRGYRGYQRLPLSYITEYTGFIR